MRGAHRAQRASCGTRANFPPKPLESAPILDGILELCHQRLLVVLLDAQFLLDLPAMGPRHKHDTASAGGSVDTLIGAGKTGHIDRRKRLAESPQ